MKDNFDNSFDIYTKADYQLEEIIKDIKSYLETEKGV